MLELSAENLADQEGHMKITDEKAIEYRKLEELANQVNKALDSLILATLEANLRMEEKAKIVSWIDERTQMFRPLPYFLHPQSEWTGGENFVTNAPHIVA
jgi:hypothetical protein